LRNKNCFLALSYSILEAARQCSEGGCTAFADEQGSAKIAALTANNLAATTLFLAVQNRPRFIGSNPPKAPPHPPIKAANHTSRQCKADGN
jgi:hypothetical protein